MLKGTGTVREGGKEEEGREARDETGG